MRDPPASCRSLDGSFHHLKTPAVDAPAAQQDPKVVETVSTMLRDIERRGMDAVREYAERLDGWRGGDVEMAPREVAATGDRLPAALRDAIDLGSERTRRFAGEQRMRLKDYQVELEPGLVTGVRYVPVSRVGRTCRPGSSR